MRKAPILLLSMLSLLSGCDGGQGDLLVTADVDSVLAQGLAAGDGPEDISDGWSLTFTRYAVHFDDVIVGKTASAGSDRLLQVRRVVDLAQIPGQVELGLLEGLTAGRWDALSYGVGSASAASECDPAVGSPDDLESLCRAMIDGSLAVVMEGQLQNPSGRSCPPDGSPDSESSCVPATELTFQFAFPLDARFVECQTQSGLGVGIPSGGQTAVALSYHAEHILYNAFGEGARTIALRAQFIANADLDLDGEVTTEELEQIDQSAFDELFTNGTELASFSAEYSLSGALLSVETAADYVRAHLMTQGHLDGEQECEPHVVP